MPQDQVVWLTQVEQLGRQIETLKLQLAATNNGRTYPRSCPNDAVGSTEKKRWRCVLVLSLSQVSCNHLVVQNLNPGPAPMVVNKDVRVGMIKPVTDSDIVCS